MMKFRLSKAIYAIFAVGATVGIFQNCGNKQMFDGLGSRMTEESTVALSSCDTPDCGAIRAGVADCAFGDQIVPDGGTVTAFLNSSVPFGSTCSSQTRFCINGTLTGTYQFESCDVNAPVACLFNGATVAHGATVTAYQASSVLEPATCVTEQRSCNNGALSGSFQFNSCAVNAPRSCTFDGRTIASGSTIIAFQSSSVPAGNSCMQEIRTCTDGTLGGSFTHATCVVDEPEACQFNGRTIASGQSVLTYQNSSVPFGQQCVTENRTCNDGQLSGSYVNESCAVGAPMTCQFDGRTIAHGQPVTAFLRSTEPFGSTCVSQSRTCSNGALSGTYEFGSCNVQAPASCLFNGRTIASGDSVIAYGASSVPFGQSCTPQSRTCTNGQLSGNAAFASCTVNAPRACLFNGATIAHGARATGYRASTVPFGARCESESRLCTDGTLGGSFAFGSCAVNAPKSCLFNGRTVPHGASATAYQAATVNYPATCVAQSRVCSNGVLSGTYAADTCKVIAPQWVNVASKTETHAQACARVGGKVPTDPKGINGQGICAAPESQPGSNGGTGWDKIKFPYGIGKYSGRRAGGGQVVVQTSGRGGTRLSCYKPGQKRDGDTTDMVVAYLCLPK